MFLCIAQGKNLFFGFLFYFYFVFNYFEKKSIYYFMYDR